MYKHKRLIPRIVSTLTACVLTFIPIIPRSATTTTQGNLVENSTVYGDVTQTYIHQLIVQNIIYVSDVNITNQEVVQFWDEQSSQFHAYPKTDIRSALPNLAENVLNSFVPHDVRGWSEPLGYQYVLLGRYYQEYVDQPILWRVLGVSGGKAYLLSDVILETMPFDNKSNEWTSSRLYRWLNSDFLNKAFSPSELEAIMNSDAGKVFIPSSAELSNPAFGFQKDINSTDPLRRAAGSLHAYNNNLWAVAESDYVNYFLRSKANKTNVHLVTSNGKVMLARIERDNVGVRPALWVDVAKLPCTNGAGTVTYPFQ